MSEAKKNNEIKQESASLNPIPAEKRIMSWGSNTMLWLGGCISIGTLAQGSAQLEAGLNLTQLFLAVAIGSLILGVCGGDRIYPDQRDHWRPVRGQQRGFSEP